MQVGTLGIFRDYLGREERQILERFEERRRLLGGFEGSLIAHYGGMAVEDGEGSLRCFASGVLPELQGWGNPPRGELPEPATS
jgi:hypothetical protein